MEIRNIGFVILKFIVWIKLKIVSYISGFLIVIKVFICFEYDFIWKDNFVSI